MVTVNQVTPIPISDLPNASSLTGNEYVPVSQANTTVKTTINALPAGMEAGVVVFGDTGGAPFPNYRTLTAGSNITLTDGGEQGSLTISSDGGGASADASYVVINASGDLDGERILAVSSSLSLTDGGSGSSVTIGTGAFSGDVSSSADSFNLTLDTVNSNVGSFTNASITVNGKGLVTAASSGSTPATAAFTTISVSGQDSIVADSPTDTLTLAEGSNITLTTDATTNTITITSSGGGSISDGDYGDITVSGTGSVWTIDNDAVTFAKMQNISNNRVLGRSAGGSGDIQALSDPIVNSVSTGNYGWSQLDGANTFYVTWGLDENLSANRTLNMILNDANRFLTFSGNLFISADATISSTNTGDQNLFSTIAVSGQSNVVADGTSDTLTLVAGSNITLTTNATTDTVTITGSGGVDIPFSFDGQGNVLTTNAQCFISHIAYNGTITGWSLLADIAGDVTLDVWKANNAVPTIANTIVASANPALSGAQQIQSTSLSGWTTSVAVGDVIIVVVESAATITKLSGSIQVTRT